MNAMIILSKCPHVNYVLSWLRFIHVIDVQRSEIHKSLVLAAISLHQPQNFQRMSQVINFFDAFSPFYSEIEYILL